MTTLSMPPQHLAAARSSSGSNRPTLKKLPALAVLILGGILAGTTALSAADKPAASPPNIIIILTDDQGYADVGFNGCKDIPTPNLDSIAANGVRFSNGYVSYTVCSPSRAGLLTGRYPQRFGHERNPRFEPDNPRSGLPLTENTLADVLGIAGYHNGIIGKWHLGAHPDLHPLKRGFHEFFGFLGGGHRYLPGELTMKRSTDAKSEADSYRLQILRGNTPVGTSQYLTDEFSDEAVRFVERNKEKPFFLYLAYNAPHTPMQASQKYLDRFASIKNPKRRTYAAMVSAVDDGVGRVLSKVRELGLDEKTLVFFLSDNGGPIDANASSNRPLRGSKGSPWEGGWRVPFAAQWTGHLPRGKLYEAPVLSLDIFATAAALAHAPINPARPLDGVNLMPFLKEEQTGVPHEAIYLRMHDRGAFAVRSGDMKLVIPKSGAEPELFDLAADVKESRNIAGAHPEQVRSLEARRTAWNDQLVPPAFNGLQTTRPEAAQPAPAATEAAKPNIVLIIADDLGYGDLGCYGATRIKTPNIDKLAAEGVRFTQGYAPSSTCTPTRYSLLTGEYAWRQKARKNGILDGDAPLCIDPGRVTLPSMLKRAGYTTGIVGKWHLGLGDGQTLVNFNGTIKPGPLEIGFDYCHIIPATVDRVPSVWIENHSVVGLDPADPIGVSYVTNLSDEPTGLQRPDLLRQKADPQHSGTIINGISRIGFMRGGNAARFKDEELASTVVARSIAFLERHQASPFFLEVGLFEPHVPRVAEPPFVGTSQCGVRGDVIQQIDWQVGEIMKSLRRLNLDEHTLVLLSSDNGAVLFDGYFDGSVEDLNGHRPTGGLRGGKYLVFEGGCRVPLIARWPSRIQPRVSDQLFSLVDVTATLAAIVGQTLPAQSAPDSLDLSRVLLGQTDQNVRDHTVLHGISDTLALRSGHWKFIPANARGRTAGIGSGANPSDIRFAANRIPEPLLFDLSQDPDETTNVLAQHPQIAAELQSRLQAITGRPCTMKITAQILTTVLVATCLGLGAVGGHADVRYFVHPVLGDDSNPGTDPQSPLRSLDRASQLRLQPGDQVLLAAGQTFAGQLHFKELTGTAEKPVSISTYQAGNGSGDAMAGIDAKGRTAGLLLQNCSHITASNLRITANGGGTNPGMQSRFPMRCGVLVQADQPGNYAGICLSNLVVTNVFFEAPGFVRHPRETKTANGTEHYGWGIRFLNTSPDAVMRGIRISDCQIENVSHTGLKLTAPSNGLQKISVRGVRIVDAGGPGVQMSGVHQGHFSGLDVNRSGSTRDARNWKRGSGLWTWGTSDVVIERSRFQNANGPADSAGVHIDFNCRNVIVQYSLSANNAGGFCEILGNNHNCAYRYNVSVNDGHRVKGLDGAFQEGKTFWLSGYTGDRGPRSGPFNTYFYNNTIYVREDIVSKMSVTPTARGVLIANNIFCIQGRSESVAGDQNKADIALSEPPRDVVFVNNLFLRETNWPSGSPLRDASPITGNPRFHKQGGLNLEDYSPSNAKLVRNRGVPIPRIPGDPLGLLGGLGMERDILGQPIVGAPDLGAIEMPDENAPQLGLR